METSFKTCVFGGFDREDVISYIRKTAEESQKKLEALMEETEHLRVRCETAESELSALRARSAELEQQLADTEILRAEAERLRTEEETLRRENETLRGPAAQYQSLKDHIADIEISAHRRTEQFREEAVTRLRQLAARQREWCRTAQADYEQMNCQLLERLQQAEQTLRQPDMSSFRRMEEGLTALEKGLTAPEKAGE